MGSGSGCDDEEHFNNAESLRRQAAAKIREQGYRDIAALEAAEHLLQEALKCDPDDPAGKTHHLLGLACFHLQRWDEAVCRLAVAVERDASNLAAMELLAHAKTNCATSVQLPMGPTCPFDAGQLRNPPERALRAPQGIEPFSHDGGRRRARLLRRGVDRLLGRFIDGLSRIAYARRKKGVLYAFESWDKRRFLGGQLELVHIRRLLNRDALQSTYPGPVGRQQAGQTRPAWTERFRTATGAWTTDDPMEGAAGTELQRTGSPLEKRKSRVEDPELPHPREVSRLMLASRGPRETVPFLNMLTVAWIQPQLHDWLSHAPALPHEGAYTVALPKGDPLCEPYGIKALHVPKSASNPLRQPGELAYLNESTHWWDASHIYGSDQATQDGLRLGFDGACQPDGKLRMEGGLLPLDKATGLEITGFGRNWWLGSSLFHTLFVKHHNFICDVLKQAHPRWSTDQLFHTARLVNAAILAKIHTVEWTPAVLPNKKIASGMAINWWGFGERLLRPVAERRVRRGYEPEHEVLGGIVGGRRNNHGKPYGITEEFSEIYRLHAAIPDFIEVRPLGNKPQQRIPTDATRGAMARRLLEQHGMADLINSFGHQHMPALVNNNYPAFAGAMSVEGQAVIDLGTADILRARERGVPQYNAFRDMLDLKPIEKFEDLGCDAATLANLQLLYKGDVDRMDLLVGTSCERRRPENFGFGETMFTVFIQMASRRLQADPFYTEKFNAQYYTKEGMELIERATLKGILLQHFPELAATGLALVDNPFEPWGTNAQTCSKEHPLSALENYGPRHTMLRLRECATGELFIVDLAAACVYGRAAPKANVDRGNEIRGEAASPILQSALTYHATSELAVPGRKTPDGRFEVRGPLSRKEREHFHAGRGVPAERAPLLLHLDFFDRDLDGRIGLFENYRGWRRLGYGRLAAARKTAFSAALFGWASGFSIYVDRLQGKRFAGNTGIYDASGSINHLRLDQYCAEFRAKGGQLDFDEVMALLRRNAASGFVSARQFKSLFEVCQRLNNGARVVTEAQFRGLFDGSLLWAAESRTSRSLHVEADTQTAGR
jgi:hypothetical protein